MKLTFHGAAGEVTGSCTLLSAGDTNILIDFGLHQGDREADQHNHTFALKSLIEQGRIHAVVLTHAHIDHSGRLPLLTQWGYKGPIYATPASIDLSAILLRDSAHVQEIDALSVRYYKNQPVPAPQPLYSHEDVEAVLLLFKPVPFEKFRDIAPGIAVRFFDSGHILGSASLEFKVSEGSHTKTIVFSGDLGPKGVPLMRDPTPPPQADVVILESTYGDRDHRPMDQTCAEFEKIIGQSMWDKEKVIIPAFAVGRTQQMLYHLGNMMRSGRVPSFPVYVDSPMAISATELYKRHEELFDADALKLLHDGVEILDRPEFHFTRTKQESQKLNELWCCAVIMAASGMCTGGRIVHHLKHNLWRRGVHVIIAGYQAQGSLGRRLVEGAKEVRIHGDIVPVRAQIHTLGGFSAHAGQSDLVDWASHLAPGKPKVILNHGEDMQRNTLAALLKSRFGWDATLPTYQQVVEL